MTHTHRITASLTPMLIVSGLIWILGIQNVESLPRFTAEQGVACSQCHFAPGGGAQRDEFGHHTMSLNELTLQSTKKKLLESYKSPRLSESVIIGSDIRMRFVEEGAVERYQTDFYLSAEMFSRTFFNLTFGAGSIDESYLLITNEMKELYVQVGRYYPQYGLRLEDFSSFVKSATAVFHRKALEGISIGATVSNTNISASYYAEGKQSVYFGNIYGARMIGKIGLYGGLSARFSEKLDNGTHGAFPAIKGVYGGVGYRGYSLIFETDLIGESNDSYATYLGGTLRIIPGLYVKADYNFYDPDRRLASGAESFTRASIEFWPMPFVEINPGIKFFTEGALDGEQEFELRFHIAY